MKFGNPLTIPILLLVFCGNVAAQHSTPDGTKPIIAEGETRLRENQAAQKNVDQVDGEARKMEEEYQRLIKMVEDLKMYNQILARQLDNQAADMATMQSSIANAAVIQRQILPLLTRMLDGLDEFIRLDTPFLLSERQARVKSLRRLLDRSDISNAEKARRVFEAFQIEIDYGNTLESYKGKLELGASTFDVDYLRVGRVVFAYRSVGADQYGYWDRDSGNWQLLSGGSHGRNIDKGIKMARQEMAPELLTLPIVNAGRAAQ